MEDVWYFVIMMWCAHNVTFYAWALPCQWLYKANYFQHWKILPDRHPDEDLIKDTHWKQLLLRVFLFPAMWYAIWQYVYVPQLSAAGQSPVWPPLLSASPEPTALATLALQLTLHFYAFFLINCFVHRMMHKVPFLYKFHKHHHEFKITTGAASEHFDLYGVDSVANGVATFFFPLMLSSTRLHPTLLAVYFALRTWESVDTHTGYAFPWTPFRYLPGMAYQQEYHAYHHSNNQGTYSCLAIDHFLTDEARPFLKMQNKSFLNSVTYGVLGNGLPYADARHNNAKKK